MIHRRSTAIIASIILAIAFCFVSLARADEDIVIPLKIDSGRNAERDTRTYAVPVEIGDVKADFAWGCSGENMVTESFANKAGLKVVANDDLAQYTDASGKPMFAGEANGQIKLGGVTHDFYCWVMHDSPYNKGLTGQLGHQIAEKYQWILDPRIPRLTLRPSGSPPTTQPLETLHITPGPTPTVNIKVRNAPADLQILPQSSDCQADPVLQKAWDMTDGGETSNVVTSLGKVRTLMIKGKDNVTFSIALQESNVLIILLDEGTSQESGLGASLLNRFVYAVDVKDEKLYLLQHVPAPEAKAKTK